MVLQKRIRQELKEFTHREELLNNQLLELTNLLNNTHNTEYNMNVMMEAVQYYLRKVKRSLLLMRNVI